MSLCEYCHKPLPARKPGQRGSIRRYCPPPRKCKRKARHEKEQRVLQAARKMVAA